MVSVFSGLSVCFCVNLERWFVEREKERGYEMVCGKECRWVTQEKRHACKGVSAALGSLNRPRNVRSDVVVVLFHTCFTIHAGHVEQFRRLASEVVVTAADDCSVREFSFTRGGKSRATEGQRYRSGDGGRT